MALKSILPPGLRQNQIAAALNVSEPMVSRWMNGSMDVPSRHLPLLSEMFGVPVDVLVAHAVSKPTARRAA